MNLLITQNSQNLSHSHTTNSQSTTSARTSTNIYNSSNTEITNTGAMTGYDYAGFTPWGYYDGLEPTGRTSRYSTTARAYAINEGANGGKLTINLAHTHDMKHNHTVDISHTHGTTSNGGDEARPVDYTYKIWKRTA